MLDYLGKFQKFQRDEQSDLWKRVMGSVFFSLNAIKISKNHKKYKAFEKYTFSFKKIYLSS